MANNPGDEPDFPKTEWKYDKRGIIPAFKFVTTHKRDSVLALTRAVCLISSFYYFFYVYAFFNFTKEADVYYLTAFLAHASTSAIRLYCRTTHPEISVDFFLGFIFEDSFQHLIFSAIFLFDLYLIGQPKLGLDLFVLVNVCIHSGLLFNGYLLSFLYVLGFRWSPIVDALKVVVGRKALYIINLHAFMEVALYLPIVLNTLAHLLFSSKHSHLFLLNLVIMYPMYLWLRFRSFNNQYGWSLLLNIFYLLYIGVRLQFQVMRFMFREMRQYFSAQLFFVRNAIRQILLSVNGQVSPV